MATRLIGNNPAVTPLEQFDRTIARAEAIISLHKATYAVQGRPPQKWSDVLRGALMLAVAALDALVDDLLVECLPRAILAGKQGAKVNDWIKEHPHKALAALADPAPPAILTKWVADRHEKDSFVQPHVIEGALREELGCPIATGGANEPWDSMSDLMQQAAGASWSSADCKANLARIVRRRNDIAHDGDVGANGKTNSIRRQQVEVAVLAIACAGRAVDQVIRTHIP